MLPPVDWESGRFPVLGLDVLLCEIIIITFLSLRGFLKWINTVTPSKPSTKADFFPSFDTELKPASHREGGGGSNDGGDVENPTCQQLVNISTVELDHCEWLL